MASTITYTADIGTDGVVTCGICQVRIATMPKKTFDREMARISKGLTPVTPAITQRSIHNHWDKAHPQEPR